MSEDAPLGGRIVVGLEESAECLSGLETAARLASALAAELHGVFVEDMDLLAAAGLPVTGLIGYEGGERRAVDETAMRRSLKIRAEALRQRLAKVASLYGVGWSFETRRGFVSEQLLDYVNPGDILALGASARRRRGGTATRVSSGAVCAVLVASRSERSGGVLLMSTGQADALRMAANLAESFAIPLHVQPLSEAAEAVARETLSERIKARTKILPAEPGAPALLDALLAYDPPAFLVSDAAAAQSLALDPAETAGRPGLSGVLVVRRDNGP